MPPPANASLREPVLRAVPTGAEAVFAYEPVWAIGAKKPAAPEHILSVAAQLNDRLARRTGRTRLVYGGSAGPGDFVLIAEGVDGLFLGRYAHDIDNLQTVLTEIVSI